MLVKADRLNHNLLLKDSYSFPETLKRKSEHRVSQKKTKKVWNPK